MQLPEPFHTNIKLFFGKDGKKWLNDLPEIISYCEKRWDMKVGEPFKLSFNYVAPATTKEGKEVVLKLSVPGYEGAQELQALKIFNGDGINKLIDYDEEKAIMILERIFPGEMLSTITDEETAVKISSNALSKLWTPVTATLSLPTVADRSQAVKGYAEKHKNGFGPINGETLQLAANVFQYMVETTKEKSLLHGDFHHYNVLSDGEGWIAIDPKGLIGEREYDLSQYMLNCLPKSRKEKAETIDLRAELFAKHLMLNKDRILLWGFCHSVLSLCWSISEEDSEAQYDTSSVHTFVDLINQKNLLPTK
jgi:streptomycin 6-kinase